MHSSFLLTSFLLATSAVAGPNLLRRDGCFIGPHGIGGCDQAYRERKASAAAAASASAQSASAVSASADYASSAAAASDRRALGRSQASVASAILASISVVQVQEKLAITSAADAGAAVPSPTSTYSVITAGNIGFEFAQAARYGHG